MQQNYCTAAAKQAITGGDVGGTKVYLALYDFSNGKLDYRREERFPAREYAGLEAIVAEFLGGDKATAACFGVPGPVRDGRLRLTNLPWTLDARELSLQLNIDHVFLINDLEANGYGIAELQPNQIYTLSDGDPSQIGNRALIAAGTGLGEGLLRGTAASMSPFPPKAGMRTTRRAMKRRSSCSVFSSRNTWDGSVGSAW